MADDKTTDTTTPDGDAGGAAKTPAQKPPAKEVKKKPAAKKPATKPRGTSDAGGDLVLTGKGSVSAGRTIYRYGDVVAAEVVAELPKRQRAYFTAADGDTADGDA